MASPFHLNIVSLDRALYNDNAFSVSIPTSMGEITVLPNHAPLITAVVPGEIRIKVEKGKGIFSDDEVYIAVGGGFLEVANNRVSILADSAERVDEIDEQRALEAKKRAEDRLLELRKKAHMGEDVAFADAAAALATHLARLKVLDRKKRHHRG